MKKFIISLTTLAIFCCWSAAHAQVQCLSILKSEIKSPIDTEDFMTEIGKLEDPSGSGYIQAYGSTQPKKIEGNVREFWRQTLGSRIETNQSVVSIQFGARGTAMDAIQSLLLPGQSFYASPSLFPAMGVGQKIFQRPLQRDSKVASKLYLIHEKDWTESQMREFIRIHSAENPESSFVVFREWRENMERSYLDEDHPRVAESVYFAHQMTHLPSSLSLTVAHPTITSAFQRSSENRGSWIGRFDQIAIDYFLRTVRHHSSPDSSRAVHFRDQLKLVEKTESEHLASDFLDLFPGFRGRDLDKAFNLGLGQPLIEIAKDAVMKSFRESMILPEAEINQRLAVNLRKWYQEKYGVHLPLHMTVAEGVSGAFIKLFHSLPANAVIGVPDLAYSTYASVAEMFGLRLKLIKIDPDRPESMNIPSDVTVMVVNFPHNPTGKTLNSRMAAKLHQLATDGVVVINDLSYTRFSYGSTPITSLFKGAASVKNLIEVFSSSKDMGLPEARISGILGDAAIIEKMRIYQNNFDPVSSFRKNLLARVLSDPSVHLTTQTEMTARVEAALVAMRSIGWPEEGIVRPDGGLNIMLKLPPGVDSREVARKLWAQAQVMVMPGKFFSSADTEVDFVRISLSENSQRMETLASHLKQKNVSYIGLIQR